MQAIHIGSYPGQRAVYLMPVINIGPWEMCILLTLIFEILQSSTESCPLLCMIIHYGAGPWPPAKINQNPVCHCAKTFITFVSFLEVVEVTHIFGGKVSYWVMRGHLLADDDLKKLVASKMIGMPLPVDCSRPGIWWWDSWCSSRCHCYGWVCRYWCQCCEWAWQY